MEPNTSTYKEMYVGKMSVFDPAYPLEPYDDYSSVYYSETAAFEITGTHKLAQDKPTVTVKIPFDTILENDLEF